MKKTIDNSKHEKLARALFQDFLLKNKIDFPRHPRVWAAAAPTPPVRGLLMSEAEYELKLAAYKTKLKRHREFNPELYYVLKYLSGDVVADDKGNHSQVYFGTFTELQGRRILSSLLRSEVEIPHTVRKELASLLDPMAGHTQQSERKFEIQFRNKGKHRNLIREMQVSEEISSVLNQGGLVKVAVDNVIRKHGIRRSEVLRIWGKNRDDFVSLGWVKEISRTKSKLKPQ